MMLTTAPSGMAERRLTPTTGGDSRTMPRILVVDDEPSIRELFLDVGWDAGWDVQTASAPEEAVKISEITPLDLAFVDLVMPGSDGLSLVADLRQKGKTFDVTMMTAYPTVERAITALKLGACDFLLKPFGPSEIQRVVDTVHGARPSRIRMDGRRAWDAISDPTLEQLAIESDTAMGFLTLLRGQFAGRLEPRQERYFKIAQCELDALSAALRAFWHLTRTEHLKEVREPQLIDADQMVRMAMTRHLQDHPMRQINRLSVDSSLPAVLGDPHQLAQLTEIVLERAVQEAGALGRLSLDVYCAGDMLAIEAVAVREKAAPPCWRTGLWQIQRALAGKIARLHGGAFTEDRSHRSTLISVLLPVR